MQPPGTRVPTRIPIFLRGGRKQEDVVSHEGVLVAARPVHVAARPARVPSDGGVEAVGEGQHHRQPPDTHYHHLGGRGGEARLQWVDDGHVPEEMEGLKSVGLGCKSLNWRV